MTDLIDCDMVIYHADCSDGFTAAWVAYRYYKDSDKMPEFIPARYDQDLSQLGDFDDKHVLIVDVSFSMEQLRPLIAGCKSLRLLDHHESAYNKLKDASFAHFDLTKSGAMLAWEYFFDEEPPKIVEYIQDRDLWKWELLHSKKVSAYIQSYEKTFDNWDEIFEDLEERFYNQVFFGGQAVLANQAQQIREILKHKIYEDWPEGKVQMVNSPILQSELCNQMLKDDPNCVAVCYLHTGDNHVKYSVRSTDTLLAANKIAEARGGGGHRNAAGFSV